MVSFSKVVSWFLGIIALVASGFFVYRIVFALHKVQLFFVDTFFAIFLGVLAADFVSGLVHWACDTWGRSSFPIVGPVVLKSFRLHHIDQLGITRHDFFEANLLNFLIVVPVLFGASSIELVSRFSVFMVLFLLSLGLCSMLTNQVHKWAHQKKTSSIVLFLQKYGIILSPVAHKKHHSLPYMHAYCITTGWMNKPLDKVRFWRFLEFVVSSITGATPRAEERVMHE